MEQVLLLLLIGIYDTWDTKGSHGPVFFFRQVLVLKNICSVKLCLCQSLIQPNITVIFWGTGRLLYILMINPTKIMCSGYDKISIRQTEESSLSGKAHIRTR